MAWCTPEIEFDREIYFPGETVIGRAFVSTKKDMTARNVEITFFGKSLTAWRTDGDRRNKPVAEQSYKKAEETYVEMKHEVWTPNDENDTFPAGDYEWKFSFELPKECPASFEGKFGFIRFWVQVHIDVPLWIDTRVERAITVSPTIDLNSIPGARTSVRVEKNKTMDKCCCLPFLGNNGTVHYVLSSPQLGYVAGDTLTISGTIHNQSSKPIETIESTFKRKVIYRKDMKNSIFKTNDNILQVLDSENSKSEEWVMEEKTIDCPIASGETKPYEFTFKIPPVCATIRGSGLISVEYLVTIAADRWCWEPTEPVTLNIILGNVPFLEPGTTTLPPHKFVDGDLAECWTSALHRQNFRNKFPYYGDDEPKINEKE